MARHENAQFVRSLAVEYARVVVAHLDDPGIMLRWLSALVDGAHDDVPRFNRAAFLDVLGGEIMQRAPDDARVRGLVGDLLLRARQSAPAATSWPSSPELR